MDTQPGRAPAPSIDAGEAEQWIRDGAMLLDVREDDEWVAGHAPTARHLPLGDLPTHSDDLPLDRPIVCVCRSGGRSQRAADWLVERGYDAWNLTGGMHAWSVVPLSVVLDDGSEGTVL